MISPSSLLSPPIGALQNASLDPSGGEGLSLQRLNGMIDREGGKGFRALKRSTGRKEKGRSSAEEKKGRTKKRPSPHRRREGGCACSKRERGKKTPLPSQKRGAITKETARIESLWRRVAFFPFVGFQLEKEVAFEETSFSFRGGRLAFLRGGGGQGGLHDVPVHAKEGDVRPVKSPNPPYGCGGGKKGALALKSAGRRAGGRGGGTNFLSRAGGGGGGHSPRLGRGKKGVLSITTGISADGTCGKTYCRGRKGVFTLLRRVLGRARAQWCVVLRLCARQREKKKGERARCSSPLRPPHPNEHKGNEPRPCFAYPAAVPKKKRRRNVNPFFKGKKE